MGIGTKWAMALTLTVLPATTGAANVANFDDLPLGAESYWNGSDNSGGFTSGIASFNNSFTDWGGGFSSWEDFAYSNLSQQQPPLDGLTGQYTAITGSAQSGNNYAIGYVGYSGLPTMTLNNPSLLAGLYLTNDNYPYYSMLNGDFFSKKFGGANGNDPDWLKLTIEGFDSQGNTTGSVDFYLADYRFTDNGMDYIIDEWTWANLTSLGEVKKITFNLSSSDVGRWGMNTPSYFAMDTVTAAQVLPEPGCCLLLGLGGLLLARKHG